MPKFKQAKPVQVAKPVEAKQASFNYGKAVTIAFVAGVVVSAFYIVGIFLHKEYTSWANAWDQVQFAKNNPEIVKVIQLDYEKELEGVNQKFLTPDTIEEDSSKL